MGIMGFRIFYSTRLYRFETQSSPLKMKKKKNLRYWKKSKQHPCVKVIMAVYISSVWSCNNNATLPNIFILEITSSYNFQNDPCACKIQIQNGSYVYPIKKKQKLHFPPPSPVGELETSSKVLLTYKRALKGSIGQGSFLEMNCSLLLVRMFTPQMDA